MPVLAEKRVRDGFEKCGVAAVILVVQRLYGGFGNLSMPSAINMNTGEPVTATGATGIGHTLPPADLSVLIGSGLGLAVVLLFGLAMIDFYAGLRV